MKLSNGQTVVLIATSLPMASIGAAGAVATYYNMDNILHRATAALGLVAAGEGATLICALIALAVTLMGQHTPAPVRLGMWLIPLVASGVGIALAPTVDEKIVMAVTPLAMTAAGEGIAFVARRVVAYRTGTDIEQQRRSGLLLWHAKRAADGSALGRKISKAAVWRLTKQFAATDEQLSVQLGEVQRYRIGESADTYLTAALSRPDKESPERPSVAPAPPSPALPPAKAPQAAVEAYGGQRETERLEAWADEHTGDTEGLPGWMQDAIDEEAARSALVPSVKLLTSDDVAVQLNVKPGTVRSWVQRGKLKVYERDANGRSLFHPEDVAKLP